MTSAGTLPTLPLVQVGLHSPITGVSRTQIVNRPIGGDALILRRYTKDWKAPDDRKVNPWDLNEPDPTDAGTMGTIPGPSSTWLTLDGDNNGAANPLKIINNYPDVIFYESLSQKIFVFSFRVSFPLLLWES